MNDSKLNYVLITPAYNEEEFIEKTIRSVVNQTILPLKWIIVSDGSTDKTDDIVNKYLDHYSWLELVRLSRDQNRNFAAKVYAFKAGYKKIESLAYDLIGNVDADVSFSPDYFEFLIDKFAEDNRLGAAGTHYTEGDFHSFNDSFINVKHVNGGVQLFTKKCFIDIGGYVPINGGGVDWVAVTTARMKGWKTYSFSERTFHHHRPIGTAESNTLNASLHYGKKDYFLGGHPLWQLARGLFQMKNKPYIIGGLFLWLGYFYSFFRRVKKPISDELVKFYRKEQMSRLKALFRKKLKLNRS